MKKWMLVAALTVAGVAAYAQMSVGMKLNRDTFIQYEPVYAQVTIRNDSGQTLVFGGESALQGQLNFEITDPLGQQLRMELSSPEQNPLRGVILKSGQQESYVVALHKYFKMERVGNYRVNAWVSHSKLKEEYFSKTLTFEVSPGILIWSKNVGLPDFSGELNDSGRKTEERTYELRLLQSNSERSVFLVIRDESMVYALIPLGMALGQEKIRCDVDGFARLHMLVPLSPKIFQYHLITPQGTSEENHIYRTAATVPMLVRDPESGRITVAGGEEITLDTAFEVPEDAPVPEVPEL